VSWISGNILILLGLLFLAPSILVAASHLFYYTVAWSPVWIPKLLFVMALCGAVSFLGGIIVFRRTKQ
jgi:hypothetical protein